MDSSATPSDPRTTAPPPSGAETLAALTRSGELAAFIGRQRWFAAKHRRIERLEPLDTATVAGDVPFVLALVSVDGERYYLPLALRPAATPPVAPSEREVGRVGDWVAYDAHWEPRFGPWALESITWERRLPARAGAFTFHRAGDAKPADGDELAELVGTPLADEQSNTSTRLGRRFIFKSFRRPQPGPNPEIEVSHFLTTRTGFAHAAGLVGWIEYAPAQGESSAVGLLQPFLENLGDGWRDMQDHLRRLGDALVQEPAPARRDRRERRLRELGGDLIEDMALLGSVTGELHAALAGDDSLPAFAPEPVTEEDVGRWTQAVRADAERLLATLGPGTARLPDRVRRAARRLRGISARLEPRLADLALLSGGQTWKIRGHGDYHLGQVLRTPAGFAVIDFEGEPARPLAERRAKHSALRDVAGMLRSFDYAARAALAARPAAEAPALGRWIGDWTRLISSAFVRGYLAAAARSARPLAPASPEAARRAAAVFEIEKALYELRYELELRPDWVPIPVAGLARLLRARRDDRDP